MYANTYKVWKNTTRDDFRLDDVFIYNKCSTDEGQACTVLESVFYQEFPNYSRYDTFWKIFQFWHPTQHVTTDTDDIFVILSWRYLKKNTDIKNIIYLKINQHHYILITYYFTR